MRPAHPVGAMDPGQRWDRIGLGIRLGYNPWHAPAIRAYLAAGATVVSAGLLPERRVQERMLSLLLQTAGDAGLPWRWRAACHEYMVWPLARLATRWRLGERDIDVTGWQHRVDAAALHLMQALAAGGEGATSA